MLSPPHAHAERAADRLTLRTPRTPALINLMFNFPARGGGGGGGGVEEKTTMRALDLRPLREGGGGEGGRRVFECKTCSRSFPTFQALGGHRTSHGRPRWGGGSSQSVQVQVQRQMLKMKPRLHACPVCGLAFPMGQALGGHMRRHRAAAGAASRDHMQFNAVGGGTAAAAAGKPQWLDLNLPPLEDELQLRCVGGEGMIESSPSSSTNNYLSTAHSSYSA